MLNFPSFRIVDNTIVNDNGLAVCKVSNRYQLVNHNDILQPIDDLLPTKGYQLHNVVATPRKTMVAVRYKGSEFTIDDEKHNYYLQVINSVDKSASLRVQLGIFRQICRNGNFAGFAMINLRLKHLKGKVDIHRILSDISNHISNTDPMKFVEFMRKLKTTDAKPLLEILRANWDNASETLLFPQGLQRRLMFREPETLFGVYQSTTEYATHRTRSLQAQLNIQNKLSELLKPILN